MHRRLSKRRGGAPPPPVDKTTSANATVAASSAFLNRPKTPTSSLSSAAAAAALRSTTSSPEPLGNIQTKRMERRASQSSQENGIKAGSNRGTLQRTNSGGSMTERTFRSPSPGQRNGTATVSSQAPPVPALPANIPAPRQRASSLDPPQRVLSPPPTSAGRNVSVDRAKRLPVTPLRTSNQRYSTALDQTGTPDSPRNVNFSRPRSPPPTSPSFSSPTDQKHTHGTGAWFSQPTGADASKAPMTSAESQKLARIQAASGSRPAPTNGYQRLPEKSQEADESVMVYDPNSRTFVTVRKAKPAEPERPPVARNTVVYDPNTRSVVPAVQLLPASGAEISQATSSAAHPPAATSPNVREHVVSQVPPPAEIKPAGGQGATTGRAAAADDRDRGAVIQTSAGPAEPYSSPATFRERHASLEIPQAPTAYGVRGRTNSKSPSPSRSPHFSSSPILEGVRHDPPPRDVSPAKSAMKHSSLRPSSALSSSRGKSPTGDISDNASAGSDDEGGVRRKKSVRVSFDERAYEMNTSPSAALHNRSPIEDLPDEYEIGKPRPALPSFGSVRRNRQTSEPSDGVLETKDASSDHAVGGILLDAKRAEAVSSEPLPPEVTSKESAGYISDASDDGEISEKRGPAGLLAVPPPTDASAKIHDPAESTALGGPRVDTKPPDINLLPPTPSVEQESTTFGSAGPEDKPTVHTEQSQVLDDGVEGTAGHTSVDPIAAVTTADQDSRDGDLSPAATTSAYTEERATILEAIDEDSDDAEFSDAAEDFTDEGGFASIDAIAVQQISVPNVNRTSAVVDKPPESPLDAKPETPADAAESTRVPSGGDWNQATTYWSNLSKQQREQLERDHMSSDDEMRPAPAPAKKHPKTSGSSPAAAATSGATLDQKSAPKQQKIQAAAAVPAVATQPAMKKSMRASAEPVPASRDAPIRKTTRPPAASAAPSTAATEGTMRKSMRAPATTGPPPAAQGSGTMPKTMRSPPAAPPKGPNEVTMRKSMRAPAEPRPVTSDGGMRQGMRANVAPTRDAPSQRPQSAYVESRGALQSRTLRPATAGQSGSVGGLDQQTKRQSAPQMPIVSTRLNKELAQDSDSESSFKKKKKATQPNQDAQGRYDMRRSMRGPSNRDSSFEERPSSPPASARRKGSLSIRSLSPSGSSFWSRNRGEKATESVRNSKDVGTRMTMRGSGPSARDKKATRAEPASRNLGGQSSMASRFKSRFVDSDDDDDDDTPHRGGPFRSRFADSDDEDEGVMSGVSTNFAPVRGIPKKSNRNDGDSTDLEDDSDDPKSTQKNKRKQPKVFTPDPAEVERAMAAARKKLGLPQESIADTGPMKEPDQAVLTSNDPPEPEHEPQIESQLQPEPKSRLEELAPGKSEKKRRIGNFWRRNRDSVVVPEHGQASPAAVPSSPTAIPSSPVAVPSSPVAVPSSPTAVAPPPAAPAAAAATEPPSTPTMRRKSTDRMSLRSRMKRGDSNFSTATAPAAVGEAKDNWPLAPPVPKVPDKYLSAYGRPSTSDGNVPNNQPGRSASVHFEDPRDSGAIYSQRTGKKKKFGMLRRAFGLND